MTGCRARHPMCERGFMNINLANFKKLTVALVVLGLAVVGTYAVRSVLHRSSPAIADAHKGDIVAVAFAAAPPLASA